MSDERLRARFAALRGAEERAAPGFRQTLAAARARAEGAGGRGRRWLWAPVLAAAGVVLALLLPRSPAPPPEPWAPSWAMPTDVLLAVPGSELLHELPSIGTPRTPRAPLPRTSTLRRTLT